MTARLLGRIALLQVQRSPVKTKGVGYDPAPILQVEAAAIGPLGMVGLREGSWIVDAHHAAHPRVKGGGNRALSIGFAGHYEAMAARFGYAPLGIAGENVVLDTPGIVSEDDLGVLAVGDAGGPLVLHSARPAAPCREFTSFITGRDHVADREEIAADLAFLEHGTRGFILATDRLAAPLPVCVGDPVWVIAGQGPG